MTEVPRPEPKADEVLVRLECVGLAFGGIGMLLGTFQASHTYGTELPYIPGCEDGGTITAVGSEVRDLAVGDSVVYSMHEKSYARYATVPAWRVVPMPDDLSRLYRAPWKGAFSLWVRTPRNSCRFGW